MSAEGGFAPDRKTFSAFEMIDLIKDCWKFPRYVPASFPQDYPPKAPLLDVPLFSDAAADLRQAFTHNNVSYALDDPPTNVVLEAFGDRYVTFLLT